VLGSSWASKSPFFTGCPSLKSTLTIASVTPEYFTIALIPETSRRTTLGTKGVGARVNIEIDPVARYAFAAMDEYRGTSEASTATDAELEGVEETFHLSQRAFILQGSPFRLYLLKRLTRELSRQEVSTWKKLIRVLSHELNNSLGPLSSLAHSGAEIARRGDHSTLPAVFAAIGERAEHLHHFVSGYATFARLPAPRPERIEWAGFVADLARQQAFTVAGILPSVPGWFDRSQVEQALINLLKNAHEAGGAEAEVDVLILCAGTDQRIEVRDRGSGMSQVVLAQALLPFYSTKRSGTGLGLALAREIAEAHGGRIQLANREGGGLSVVLDFPYAPRNE